MVFSSNSFYYLFLPATLLAYFVIRPSARNVALLIASLIFYYYGEANRVWILATSIVINYILALCMANNTWSLKAPSVLPKQGERTRFQKRIIALAVTANLLFLCYFKYINFAIINLDRLFVNVHLPFELEPLATFALPLGISFFTF
ncbi:MAG: hypothetical protein QNI85_13700, partial [Desulfobacterales bacterium]|nr:hypothetical protein [Desulfobacterales bacterium]